MNKYLGVKLISALAMSLAAAEATLKRNVGYTGPTNENGNVDGYLVEYEGGYQSWSPKDVFEEAYRQIDGLTFGLAIEALKKGFKVARSGWNGKDMWLAYINPIGQGINDESLYYKVNHVGDYGLLPWIGMKTADNKFVPWLASQTDVLAEDWQIVH